MESEKLLELIAQTQDELYNSTAASAEAKELSNRLKMLWEKYYQGEELIAKVNRMEAEQELERDKFEQSKLDHIDELELENRKLKQERTSSRWHNGLTIGSMFMQLGSFAAICGMSLTGHMVWPKEGFQMLKGMKNPK